MREKLIRQIEKYVPCNEQERQDKELILEMLCTQEHIFTRENRQAHMTASAWIVNRERTKTVMAYHKIYDSWAWLGGHADGEEDLLKVALKEVQEESGLKNIQPVREDIFSLEVLTVDGHEKRGKYVSSHLHLNVTYLIEADEKERTQSKEDENSGVEWFMFEEALEASSEKWFVERIYSKLVSKTRCIPKPGNI